MAHQITLSDIQFFKEQNKPFTVLTAYDFPFAKLLDEAGVDMILVGDSLANVVLGLESTREVGIEEMVYHAKAVCRAVERAFVVGDMPYGAYQGELKPGFEPGTPARRLLEAGCDAVKVEWFDRCPEVVRRLCADGVPVVGHVGLTPQTAEETGGFKVRGRTAQAAKQVYDQALALEEAGCFSVVVECVPDRVAGVVTRALKVPTIGIGAGPDCDGQVLVLHDTLGLFHGKSPKFVKKFCDLSAVVKEGLGRYVREVSQKRFPSREHSYGIDDKEFAAFQDCIFEAD